MYCDRKHCTAKIIVIPRSERPIDLSMSSVNQGSWGSDILWQLKHACSWSKRQVKFVLFNQPNMMDSITHHVTQNVNSRFIMQRLRFNWFLSPLLYTITLGVYQVPRISEFLKSYGLISDLRVWPYYIRFILVVSLTKASSWLSLWVAPSWRLKTVRGQVPGD
jgi:hypothetical protein